MSEERSEAERQTEQMRIRTSENPDWESTEAEKQAAQEYFAQSSEAVYTAEFPAEGRSIDYFELEARQKELEKQVEDLQVQLRAQRSVKAAKREVKNRRKLLRQAAFIIQRLWDSEVHHQPAGIDNIALANALSVVRSEIHNRKQTA